MPISQKIVRLQMLGNLLMIYLVGSVIKTISLDAISYDIISRLNNPEGVFLKEEGKRVILCANNMKDIQKLFKQASVETLPGQLPCPDSKQTFCLRCGKGCIINQLRVA